MNGKNQNVVCHVIKIKHGDECMQNLKEKEDFDSTRRRKWHKPLFVRAKVFMKVFKRGDVFYLQFSFIDVDQPCPHEIPSQYQEF
jgi:hypothetical protein